MPSAEHEIEHKHSASAESETAGETREKSCQYSLHRISILTPAQSMKRAKILVEYFRRYLRQNERAENASYKPLAGDRGASPKVTFLCKYIPRSPRSAA